MGDAEEEPAGDAEEEPAGDAEEDCGRRRGGARGRPHGIPRDPA